MSDDHHKIRNIMNLHKSILKMINAVGESSDQLTLCTMLMADVICANFTQSREARLAAASFADNLLKETLQERGQTH